MLAFRKLTLEALHNVSCYIFYLCGYVFVFMQVLSYRIPFLLSSITDFMLHPPKDKPTVATEIASVAGITCDLDPALTTAMSYHCGE